MMKLSGIRLIGLSDNLMHYFRIRGFSMRVQQHRYVSDIFEIILRHFACDDVVDPSSFDLRKGLLQDAVESCRNLMANFAVLGRKRGVFHAARRKQNIISSIMAMLRIIDKIFKNAHSNVSSCVLQYTLEQCLHRGYDILLIILLFTGQMTEKLIAVFEDFVRIVREDNHQEISNYLKNHTLPARVKNILQGMQALKQNAREGGGDGVLLIVALNKFKEDIIVGAQDITQTFKDPSIPIAFRESLRDIFFEFESKNKQLDSMFRDAFFYKDVIQAILDDKQITKEEIAMHENIAEDKRMSAIKLLAKIDDFRQGRGKKKKIGMKEGELKAEIEAFKIEIGQMEKQVAKGRIELVKLYEELAQTRKNLEEKDKQKQQDRRQIDKLKEEIVQMSKQSEIFQSSLALKQLDSGKLIAQKQSALQQLKDRDILIRQLKKNLNDQTKELQKMKRVQFEQEQTKIVQMQKILKQSNMKLKETELKCQTLQKRLNEAEQALKEKRKQIEVLQQQKEKIRKQSSIIAEDIELVRRASALLQSAEMFSQVYQNSSHRAESSILNESLIFNSSIDSIKMSLSASRKQEKIELKQFLKNHVHPSILDKIIEALPKLPFSEVKYRYHQDKGLTFKKKLKGQNNLLLFCKVLNGAVLGAFSSCGFIDTQKASKPQVFIFCAKQKSFFLMHPKQGRKGISDDQDYLIFGNEQLSLGQGFNYATSYFQNSIQNLHFSGTFQERSQILNLLDCHPPAYHIVFSQYDILQLCPSK